MIQVWPVDGAHLPGWLDQRMRNRGLIPNVGVAGWLAERVEGNLLAAAQEIEKLLLLHGEGPVSLERMMSGVADSARYTVFDLADSALEGKSARCLRVLQLLRAEGTADALVLWALTREARLLAGLAAETRTGRPLEQVVGGRREIWEKKRSLYVGAVKRHRPAAWLRILAACGQADAMVKGACKGDPWLAMEDIVLAISRKGAVIDVLPGQRAHCGA